MLRCDRIARHIVAQHSAAAAASEAQVETETELIKAVQAKDLFTNAPSAAFDAAAALELDRDGHVVLPGLLTEEAIAELIKSLDRIDELNKAHGAEMQRERAEAEEAGTLEEFQQAVRDRRSYGPGAVAAEHDAFLEACIGHPQMLELARAVLGPQIRYDHMVALIKHGGHQGQRWHTHQYASGAVVGSSGNDDEGLAAVATDPVSPDDPDLGFIRIFFYVNGFEKRDGSLKAIKGSHLFRDRSVSFFDGPNLHTNDGIEEEWAAGKLHPLTGEPLQVEELSAPPGSVVIMHTHAAHGVSPREEGSGTRYCVVTAYRNPGAVSQSRWITEEFAKKTTPGLTEPAGSLKRLW